MEGQNNEQVDGVEASPQTGVDASGQLVEISSVDAASRASALVTAPAQAVSAEPTYKRSLFEDDEAEPNQLLYAFTTRIEGSDIVFYCNPLPADMQKASEERLVAIQDGLTSISSMDATKLGAINDKLGELLKSQGDLFASIVDGCVMGWSDSRPWNADRRSKMRSGARAELGTNILAQGRNEFEPASFLDTSSG